MSVGAAAAFNMAGAVVGASGSMKSGNAAKRIAEYNASIDDRNAVVAAQQAKQRLFISAVEEGRLREDAVEFIANQQAAYNASGVVSGQDTALTVALESAQRADETIRNVAYNSLVDAQALEEQAVNYRLSGNIKRAEGAEQKRASRVQALNSILSGASSTAKMFV